MNYHSLPYKYLDEKNHFQLKLANFVSSGSSVRFHISTDGSHRRPGFAAKVTMMMTMMVIGMMVVMMMMIIVWGNYIKSNIIATFTH